MKVEIYNEATGTESYESETVDAGLTITSKLKLSFQDEATGQLVEVILSPHNIKQVYQQVKPFMAILSKIK
jgi:hypothetical protein